MKAVIQRVASSVVVVEGALTGKIGAGLNVLLGVAAGDSEKEATLLAGKIARLRIFEDEDGKMNRSVTDIGGGVLVISQFTLCADLRKGNRPSFTLGAPPDEANRLYEFFMQELKTAGVQQVQHGVFGAHMDVDIQNDGPVTIVMDTDLWTKKS